MQTQSKKFRGTC